MRRTSGRDGVQPLAAGEVAPHQLIRWLRETLPREVSGAELRRRRHVQAHLRLYRVKTPDQQIRLRLRNIPERELLGRDAQFRSAGAAQDVAVGRDRRT